MILFPNAKINLGLDIIHKRHDGYHDLETVMIPVGWTDILEIVPAKGVETTLTTSGRYIECPPEKNLVIKAYNALNDIFSLPKVDIYLRKIIPDGAGLGGGSSDAAFTLRGLNELFSLGMDDEKLADIAASIGADCPFFIYNRPMLCTGTGTDLSPIDIDLRDMRIVIVKPPTSVPTAEAYRNVTPSIPPVSICSIISQPVETWNGKLKNDFEPSVFKACKDAENIKTKLIDMGAVYSSMSGSGSAVYAFFKNDILSDALTESFSGCDVFLSHI